MKKKSLKRRVQEWREKNHQKTWAHSKVMIEMRAGRMKRLVCFCGNKKTEAHHRDYTKPLKVKWLCKKHHMVEHKKMFRKKIYA